MNQGALEFLNETLAGIVTLNGKQYPREKVARVYAKLNPELLYEQSNFYEGDRVRANVISGQVGFETYYPETGWTHESPAELNIQTQTPRPTKELIQMSRAFQDLTNSPQGKQLYFNEPLSQRRAEAYEKFGFTQPDPDVNLQVLDKRRFANSPTIAELLLTGDRMHYENNQLAVIEANLRKRHPNMAGVTRDNFGLYMPGDEFDFEY